MFHAFAYPSRWAARVEIPQQVAVLDSPEGEEVAATLVQDGELDERGGLCWEAADRRLAELGYRRVSAWEDTGAPGWAARCVPLAAVSAA